VLILGPKPYVIQLTGAHALQPEPISISTDGGHSMLGQPVIIQTDFHDCDSQLSGLTRIAGGVVDSRRGLVFAHKTGARRSVAQQYCGNSVLILPA
jgi:hypothetical protein